MDHSLTFLVGPKGLRGFPEEDLGGDYGGIWGNCCGICFLILLSFCGDICVGIEKGVFMIFKILIISCVLCVKARYAFCHVFVFLGSSRWTF